MEENKEFLDTEAKEQSNSENTEENVQETEVSAFEYELSELGEDIENEEVLPQNGKKHLIQVPIIISLVIVIGVLLGFLVFKCFFNTSVVGSWVIDDETTQSGATEDEASLAKTYYIFENDGTAAISYGSMKYIGTYSVSDNKISMDISSAYLTASFEYSVSGNVFTGRTLKFTDSSYNMEYTFHSEKVKIPKIKADSDFKPSDKLTGEWNYFDGTYDFSYDFKSNGTVSINQNDMLCVEGTYSYTDNKISVKYFADSEQTMELEYTLNDDSLIINGLQYLKVGSASADEVRKSLSETEK